MSRYNLRPRPSTGSEGKRHSGGDGPSEPDNGTRGSVQSRISLRRESTRAQAGSGRNSQRTGSTRTSGSSMNSRSSGGQTSSPDTALANPETAPVQNADSQLPDNQLPPRGEQSSRPGVLRKKTRWTVEMNKFLLKSFYEITGKYDKSGAYSKELRALFVAKFPQMDSVTPEMVMRQKTRICKKHVLSKDDIEELRKEVEGDLESSGPPEEQPGTAGVNKQESVDEPMNDSDCNNANAEKNNSATQLEYNFSNVNNPDSDNEELPPLSQENQYTLKQEIPKRREIE